MNGPSDLVSDRLRTDSLTNVPWPTSGHAMPSAEPSTPSLGDAAAPAVQALAASVAAAEEALIETRNAWTEDLRSRVRRRPLAALATALAVGAVLARVLR